MPGSPEAGSGTEASDQDAGTTVRRVLAAYGPPRESPASDPATRHALKALWTDIFTAAAQDMASHDHPAAAAESDPDRPILNRVTQDFSRRINISACPRGGFFAVFTKYEEDGYTPDHA